MLSPGVETWRKNLLKVSFARRQETYSDSRTRRQGPRRLAPDARDPGVWPLASAKLPFAPFLKPRGLYPLAHIKCSCTQTFRETSETPFGEFRNPSGDQNTIITYIFTSGLFRRSSSCPGSHPGLRTTFGHQHNNSTILIVTKR